MVCIWQLKEARWSNYGLGAHEGNMKYQQNEMTITLTFKSGHTILKPRVLKLSLTIYIYIHFYFDLKLYTCSTTTHYFLLLPTCVCNHSNFLLQLLHLIPNLIILFSFHFTYPGSFLLCRLLNWEMRYSHHLLFFYFIFKILYSIWANHCK